VGGRRRGATEGDTKDLLKDLNLCKLDTMSDSQTAPLRPDLELAPLPRVIGGFSTILADPPWRFSNRTGKVAPEHRRLDRYSTMSFDAIKALPIETVAAKNAHLYLWVPNALLPDGLEVLNAWGFRYVSNIVWAKRRKDGGPDGRGVGFYFRNVTELLLFGVKGSMRTLDPGRSQVNMIETRKREHSRKPDEQYDLIESCSPGPFLELFARHPRAKWTVWGDESPAEVAPRGKVHKGYQGGAILPQLFPNEHIAEPIAEALSEALKSRYREGYSVRALAEDTGYSIQRVRSLLNMAGTEMRPRGRKSS
jgi:N6-adenosine-specific RNA methylase IME4